MYSRLPKNERQILERQDKLCICFIFDLKRLSDSEFLISKSMFRQIWGTLKGNLKGTLNVATDVALLSL